MKGIGKLLMEKTVQSAKELYKSIYLESLPKFSTAVQLYEKSGFHFLKKSLGNSCHSGCDLLMLKEL